MRILLCVLIASGCATLPPQASGSRVLTEALRLTTPSGAAWVAPAGWKLELTRGVAVLESPERSPRVTLVESAEANAEAAILVTWALTHPGRPHAPEVEVFRFPPSHGWGEEASAQQPQLRVEFRRYAGVSYVIFIEGDESGLARREAQVNAIIASLTPRGMREESFAGRTPKALDAKALDVFLTQALTRLEVPGAAVAVTIGGKVAYERSLGVGTLGHPEPITPTTLFLMASVTKPMTTLMQASLVDSGLLTWDTPVTQLLPNFALGDADLTRRLALWHMSCACTGMPRRDLEDLFEYDGVTPEQRLASMREMRPTTGLGETFQYSNLMVAAGGFAAAHAYAPRLPLADAYAKVMKEKVFIPIGMNSSTVDFATVAGGEHASPHALDITGRARELALQFERNVLPIAPAGAVWSNLRDMERYALTELARGVAPGGKHVVSSASFAERLRPRAPDSDYGLGVGVSHQSGLRVIGHDGGSDGFGTSLFMLPDLDIGLVILTNVRNGSDFEQLPFNAAVKRKLLELLFEGSADIASTIIDSALSMRRSTSRRQMTGTQMEPEVDSLVGSYENENLGTMEIRRTALGAVLDVGEWQVRFGIRKQGDTEALVVLDAPFAGTVLPVGGSRASPTIAAPDPQTKYIFKRRNTQ